MMRQVFFLACFATGLGGCATPPTATLPPTTSTDQHVSTQAVAQPAPAQPVASLPQRVAVGTVVRRSTVPVSEPVATVPAAPAQFQLTGPLLSDAVAVAQPQPQPVRTAVLSPVPVTTAIAVRQPTYVSIDPGAPQTLPVAPARIDPSPAPRRRHAGPSPKGVYLAKLEDRGDAPDGDYGFILMDARDGTVLSERNADTPLAPSSMGKLLATVAILEAMGPNGRFQTRVLASGTISGGVLNGDLHLVGSGDPSLSSSDLRSLAGRVAATGLRSVNGSFYFHPHAIPTASVIHPSQPRGALYNPGIGGLNLDYNEKNGVAPVSQPGRYTASAFRAFAQQSGMSLPAPQRSDGDARGSEVAVHESQPVSAILQEMFNVSRNMTAEALGAVAAGKLSRKPSSLRDAVQITSQWMRGQIGSIGGSGWSGFDFPNHSGLSTSHRATPRQMAEIARFGHRRFGSAFTDAFSIRAMTGTSGGVSYDIRSKIGTMSYVRGLAGIMNVGGRDLAFAIMAMDPARRAGNPEAWMSKARKLEKALMTDWILESKSGVAVAGLQ